MEFYFTNFVASKTKKGLENIVFECCATQMNFHWEIFQKKKKNKKIKKKIRTACDHITGGVKNVLKLFPELSM